MIFFIHICNNTVHQNIIYYLFKFIFLQNGAEFNYFSRNLKQVQAHKVSHLKEFIPKAFPNAKQVNFYLLLYS